MFKIDFYYQVLLNSFVVGGPENPKKKRRQNL